MATFFKRFLSSFLHNMVKDLQITIISFLHASDTISYILEDGDYFLHLQL